MWREHFQQINDNHLTKLNMTQTPQGHRKSGRSQKRPHDSFSSLSREAVKLNKTKEVLNLN